MKTPINADNGTPRPNDRDPIAPRCDLNQDVEIWQKAAATWNPKSKICKNPKCPNTVVSTEAKECTQCNGLLSPAPGPTNPSLGPL